MGYLDENGLAALTGKIKGQTVELTYNEYMNLPETKLTDNKLYFVTDGEYAYVLDDEPTENSNGLVKSGGVYNYTSKIGSGTLDTTAQTIIPAINELKNGLAVKPSYSTTIIEVNSVNYTNSLSHTMTRSGWCYVFNQFNTATTGASLVISVNGLTVSEERAANIQYQNTSVFLWLNAGDVVKFSITNNNQTGCQARIYLHQ